MGYILAGAAAGVLVSSTLTCISILCIYRAFKREQASEDADELTKLSFKRGCDVIRLCAKCTIFPALFITEAFILFAFLFQHCFCFNPRTHIESDT